MSSFWTAIYFGRIHASLPERTHSLPLPLLQPSRLMFPAYQCISVKKSPCWPLLRDSSNLVPVLIHHKQDPDVQYIRGVILRTFQLMELVPSVWVKRHTISILGDDQSWALRSMGHAPGTGKVDKEWQERQSIHCNSSSPFLFFLILTRDGWVCRGGLRVRCLWLWMWVLSVLIAWACACPSLCLQISLFRCLSSLYCRVQRWASGGTPPSSALDTGEGQG